MSIVRVSILRCDFRRDVRLWFASERGSNAVGRCRKYDLAEDRSCGDADRGSTEPFGLEPTPQRLGIARPEAYVMAGCAHKRPPTVSLIIPRR